MTISRTCCETVGIALVTTCYLVQTSVAITWLQMRTNKHLLVTTNAPFRNVLQRQNELVNSKCNRLLLVKPSQSNSLANVTFYYLRE